MPKIFPVNIKINIDKSITYFTNKAQRLTKEKIGVKIDEMIHILNISYPI